MAYLNYVRYASQIADSVEPDAAARAVAQTRNFKRIQAKHDIDRPKIGRLLRNAWFTEMQLDAATEFPGFSAAANHWAPIQVYYVVYLVGRAYLEVIGHQASHDHRSTLAALSNDIRMRSRLYNPPFNAVCLGHPDIGKVQYLGVPEGTELGTYSALSTNLDPWASYAALLRTTRERMLDESIAKWKERNGRRRILAPEKDDLVRALDPTTIFHVLFRLRHRSNYADADDFISALGDSQAAEAYNSALRRICWGLLLGLEMLIARYLGKGSYQDLVERFQRQASRHRAEHLVAARLAHFQDLW